MIELREEQLRLFDELAQRLFIERMMDHIQIHFPTQVESVADEALFVRVEAIIEKAKFYNIIDQKDVCDFISLCCQFGDEFDVCVTTPWAQAILSDKESNNGRLKMLRLNQEAQKLLANESI